MEARSPSFRILLAALVAGLVIASPIPSQADGVTVALSPAAAEVEPEATFDIDIVVPVAGASFNSYDVKIEYDGTLLSFVPQSPISLQEGTLMTQACGNRWHTFNATGQVLSIVHGLLCAGVRVQGPGQLYKLRFRAGVEPGVATIRFLQARFADAGVLVSPVQTSDATVRIGSIVGVPGSPASRSDGPTLTAGQPNPFLERTTVRFVLPNPGRALLTVHSPTGALVKRLHDASVAAGVPVTLVWDGRDDQGRRVAQGVYLVRLATSSGAREAKLVKLGSP